MRKQYTYKLTETFNSISEFKRTVSNYSATIPANANDLKARRNEAKNETVDSEWYGVGTGKEIKDIEKYLDQKALKDASQKVRKALIKTFPVQSIKRKVSLAKQGQAFLPQRYFAGSDKCWARRSRGKKAIPTVTLGLSIGYNCNVTAEQAKFNGLHVAVIAGMLHHAGYAVRVIAMYANMRATGESHQKQGQTITVKEPQEQLDINRIAVALSDPRFFRHFVFQQITRNADLQGEETPLALGRTPEKQELQDACTELAEQAGYKNFHLARPARSFNDCLSKGRAMLKEITQ